MNINRRAVDVHWTADGDLYITNEGVMHLATYDHNEVLVGAVARRLQSSQGDWRDALFVGTDLLALIGAPNNAETATMLKTIITSSLTVDNLVKGNEIIIKVLPMDKYSVLVTLLIRALQGDEPIALGFTYDLRDNKMIPRLLSI